MSQKITAQMNVDAGGTTKSWAFDGNDPLAGGVAGGVVMAAATETEIAQFILGGQAGFLTANVENNGANPFTQFRIQSQAHPNSNFEDYLTNTELAAGTITQGKLVNVSSNPTALAAAGHANIVFAVNGAYAIRFLATSTVGSKGTVRGHACDN